MALNPIVSASETGMVFGKLALSSTYRLWADPHEPFDDEAESKSHAAGFLMGSSQAMSDLMLERDRHRLGLAGRVWHLSEGPRLVGPTFLI
jgi:hypothetical protein